MTPSGGIILLTHFASSIKVMYLSSFIPFQDDPAPVGQWTFIVCTSSWVYENLLQTEETQNQAEL